MVAKRPQIAMMIKQQAHAKRPPTGPSAAPKELPIVECLVHTLVRLQQIKEKKNIIHLYGSILSPCFFFILTSAMRDVHSHT